MATTINKPNSGGSEGPKVTWSAPSKLSAGMVKAQIAQPFAINPMASAAAAPVVAAASQTASKQEAIVNRAAVAAASTVTETARKPPQQIVNAANQASKMVTSVPRIDRGGAPISPSLVTPPPKSPASSEYTEPTENAYGDSTVYNAPSNIEPDKAYIPPPREMDLPGQYADYMKAKPAITNSLAAMSRKPDTAALAIAAPPLQASSVKVGIIDRILGWLGLSRTKVANARMAGEAAGMAVMSRSDTAFSIVRRVRNGDQNAMATMAAVRDAALQGNKQAEVSLRLMHEYIKAHPHDENSPASSFAGDFDGESEESNDVKAAVTLFHGPALTNDYVRKMTAHLSPYQQKAVAHGMSGGSIKAKQPIHVERAHRLGRVILAARNLQAQRTGRIGRVNADIGWELDD